MELAVKPVENGVADGGGGLLFTLSLQAQEQAVRASTRRSGVYSVYRRKAETDKNKKATFSGGLLRSPFLIWRVGRPG